MLYKAKNANHLGLASFDLLLPNGKMSINLYCKSNSQRRNLQNILNINRDLFSQKSKLEN